MPAHNQKPAVQTPASPRHIAKYTNKDGSKFITVPKGTSADSSLPPTPTAAKPFAPPPELDEPAPTVNRKKQKRRQKAAAKAAAELASNDQDDRASGQGMSRGGSAAGHQAASGTTDNQSYTSNENHADANEEAAASSKSKKSKRKKKKNAGTGPLANGTETDTYAANTDSIPPPRGSGMSRDKIWSTNNQEERERIKEFWLGLGEEDRKSLVKVEKDAVLKKMKEQQKHTCSCTVCGRKRTAIEEELEGLYDAYYLELEQFANQGEAPPMLPPSRDFSTGPLRGLRAPYAGQPPARGRMIEQLGERALEEDEEEEDEEDADDTYSEEAEDEDYSDDEPPEDFDDPHDRDVADFLTFGQSLQVKGGILTVADDLLKNDGKRFIEMMEQLAERRMAREEETREHLPRTYGHPNGSYPAPHNHPPLDDDEFDEEEDDDEEYDESQEDDYEDEEEDPMTEEQRMEEGRRMFQIFAARMFEQRVLSAYKEKVAKERQQKLLEELEEEDRQVDQQKAKKAKNAQKKKDKAAQKKLAQAEDKARREAEKAAEEAARLEAEMERVKLQQEKAEEKRLQREALRKAEEEARLKKEADRQRKLHEEREKRAKQEREARELREQERRDKEEKKLRDQEARDKRERESLMRKAKQEEDRRHKEARRAAKTQQEASAPEDSKPTKDDSKDRVSKDDPTPRNGVQPAQAVAAQSTKRGTAVPIVPIPAALPQHPSSQGGYTSPKVPVGTPALSKAPTPIRQRTVSQQNETTQQQTSTPLSQSVSGTSQDPSPLPSTPARSSPGIIGQQLRRESSSGGPPTTWQSPLAASPGGQRTMGQPPYAMPPMGMHPPPGLHHGPPPGFPNRIPHEPMYPPQFRPGPGMIGPPPGITGRGFSPAPMVPPGFSPSLHEAFPVGHSQPFAMSKDISSPPGHGRHSSIGYDGNSGSSQPLPIGRGRPSVNTSNRGRDDQDDESRRLGSRLLADDDDLTNGDHGLSGSLRSQGPGHRQGSFAQSPFIEPSFPAGLNPWGPPGHSNHFAAPPGFPGNGWGMPHPPPPGFNVGSPASGVGVFGPAAQPRHVAVRSMLCQVCQELVKVEEADAGGFATLESIKAHILTRSGDTSITDQELLDLCDTEGSSSNGGGSFDIKRMKGPSGKQRIRWVPDPADGTRGHPRSAVGAPGEIGSPLPIHSVRGM